MSAMRAVPIPEEAPSPQTYTAKAYAAQSPTSAIAAITIPRRTPQPKDVQIEILYCGVCHTDVHFAHNDFANSIPTTYPCVPGHEIVGRVVKTGNAVTKFKEGDLAAVGCMVDSDRTCESCREGEEQYCASMPVLTYNWPDKHLGGVTYGGYSQSVVVDEDFVLHVPKNLNLAAAAPLLCAGITTYAPLRRAKIRAGQKVGVVGIGGLGHMGVKLAAAFGANVVVFTTSANKTADAIRLGAHEVVNSKNDAEMQKHAGTFHFILDTVPCAAQHQSLHQPAEARRNAGVGRRSGRAFAARRVRVAVRAQAHLRLDHWRHSRDARDAGFLRRAQCHCGRRNDRHSAGQPSL